MNQNPSSEAKKKELRNRAEEILQTKISQGGLVTQEGKTQEELDQIIHELQVHQIELEMQNEELQRAQDELTAARDRYFDLFDLAPVGYFMLDEEGIILDVNLAGAELLGSTRSKLLGKPLTHFIHEQDQDIFYLRRRQAYMTRERVDSELRMLAAGSGMFNAHLNYMRTNDQSTQANQLRVIVRDITERVLLQQSLSKNTAIFSATERIAHLGGWEWDIEKDQVTLSDGLQRIYGAEKSSYSMVGFMLFVQPQDRPATHAALENALSGIEPLNFEHRIIRQSDQVERNILVSGEVIVDQSGKPVKVYAASKDVTELKAKERQLKIYADELKTLNYDLESFAYTTSHDLQAPLRKIIRFGDLVREKLADQQDTELLDYIDRIRKSAARMQALIDDLLKYSRVSNGLLAVQTVDLNRILREVIEDFKEEVQNTQAKVELADLPVLRADPTLMRQLFQNLIGNALKFHKTGEAPVVKVDSSPLPSGMVEICVQDQGIGFDEQHSEKIFRPFEYLNTKNEYPGTGIGLAICRKVVERHSGSIRARSRPGEGASFIVTLPVNSERNN